MRPRSTLRFGIALVLCFAAGDLALSPAIETGVRVAGGWGIAPALGVLLNEPHPTLGRALQLRGLDHFIGSAQ